MRLHRLTVTAFGPFAGTEDGRLRRALGRRALPVQRRHRRRQDQRPRRRLLRALRPGARRPQQAAVAAQRPRRRGCAPEVVLEADAARSPAAAHPLAAVGAAEAARRRHHRRAGQGPGRGAGRRGDGADWHDALDPARRGRAPARRPAGSLARPVLPGGPAAAGPVRRVPAGRRRQAPGPAGEPVRHRQVRRRRAVAGPRRQATARSLEEVDQRIGQLLARIAEATGADVPGDLSPGDLPARRRSRPDDLAVGRPVLRRPVRWRSVRGDLPAGDPSAGDRSPSTVGGWVAQLLATATEEQAVAARNAKRAGATAAKAVVSRRERRAGGRPAAAVGGADGAAGRARARPGRT